jgi:DNA-binding CsgD family transcriptional regulator
MRQDSLVTRNKVNALTEADRQQLGNYLEVVKAYARLTYECVYIIDYTDLSFEYVSDNPLFLCGHTAEEVLKMGYDFYFNNLSEEDLALLNQINDAGFDFFDRVPDTDKKLYSISYDFNLPNAQGRQMLVKHKLTPLLIAESGKMWKAMCIVSVSHHQQRGNVVIHKQGTDEFWKLDLATNQWHRAVQPKLAEREAEVLRLYAQGLTINQIAEKLFVAPDTVKYYRRKIFEALEVNNIVAALAYAVSNKII